VIVVFLVIVIAAVDGDFDFCQLAVKQMLTDVKFQKELLHNHNVKLRQVTS